MAVVNETLKNGAVALEAKPSPLGGRIVLAQWRGEYVVWRVSDEGDAINGQYFDTAGAAVRAYDERK